MCLAFSVEQNKRVSNVLFNPNVKNGSSERLPGTVREGTEWSRARLSFTKSSSYHNNTTLTPSVKLTAAEVQSYRNTHKLRGAGHTQCPTEASVSSSGKRGDSTAYCSVSQDYYCRMRCV